MLVTATLNIYNKIIYTKNLNHKKYCTICLKSISFQGGRNIVLNHCKFPPPPDLKDLLPFINLSVKITKYPTIKSSFN